MGAGIAILGHGQSQKLGGLSSSGLVGKIRNIAFYHQSQQHDLP
jgi:hypothetical protein